MNPLLDRSFLASWTPGPDISRADFFWAMLAIQRGWTIEETA